MTKHNLPIFKGNLVIRGKIEALTGLHIGGSNEKMQIGGVDMIVIRNPRNQYPYLPGSSIKGKMRHLLEYITGAVNQPLGGDLGQVSIDKRIVGLFGIGADITEMANDAKKMKEKITETEKKGGNNKDELDALNYIKNHLNNIGLPRLIVRDALPDEETVEMWKNLGSDANFTEYKAENTIDRLTSAANPRFAERVVEGSKFDFEIIYTAYVSEKRDGVNEEKRINDEIGRINKDVGNILMALRLLENSALGKSGTRGYGRVQFHLAEPTWLMADDYRDNTATYQNHRKEEAIVANKTLADITNDFNYPVKKA